MSGWVAIIAFIVDTIATFVTQLAYILMKKGMHKVESTGLNGTKRQLGFFTCEWMTGFAMMALGSMVHIIVLPFCDLVVLSTETALAIIMNNFMSVIYLKEKLVWKYDGPAIFLIISGSILIVTLSDYSEKTYTPDDVRRLLSSTVTIVSLFIVAIFTIGTIAQYMWHVRKLQSFNQRVNRYLAEQLARMQDLSADQRTRELAEQMIAESNTTVEEMTTRERPQRILIKVIQGFPQAMVSEICPFTGQYVRPIVKLPMITILVTTGVAVGLNLAGFTFLGELLQSGTFFDAPLLIIFMMFWCAFCSLALLFVTNFVVSIYDHLDAMPVYYSLCMIFLVIAGLTILGEGSEYPGANLAGISFGVVITVGGILILGSKKTSLEQNKNSINPASARRETETANEDESREQKYFTGGNQTLQADEKDSEAAGVDQDQDEGEAEDEVIDGQLRLLLQILMAKPAVASTAETDDINTESLLCKNEDEDEAESLTSTATTTPVRSVAPGRGNQLLIGPDPQFVSVPNKEHHSL